MFARHKKFFKINLLFLLSFLLVGCSSINKAVNGNEIIFQNEQLVSAFSLNVPEQWFSQKEVSSIHTTYHRANGIFLVRKDNDDSLLFKVSDSKNIYRWEDGNSILVDASDEDWDNADNEKSLYDRNEATETVVIKKEIDDFIQNYNPKMSGKKAFTIHKNSKYYDVISFTGVIKKGTDGLLTAISQKYKGEIYLDVYSREDNNPIVSFKKTAEDYTSTLFSQLFWYDVGTLIVPSEDLNNIVIGKFK